MSFDLKLFLSNRASLAYNNKGELIAQDTATVICMILLEVASADGQFNINEIQLIMRTLARALELSDDNAAHILSVAEYMRGQNKTYRDYIDKLTSNTTAEQHLTLLGLIAGLIYADKKVTAAEKEAILQFADALKINPQDAEKIIIEVSV